MTTDNGSAAMAVGAEQTCVRACRECGATITARSKSGRCRPCCGRLALRDPTVAAKARSGLDRFYADPANRIRVGQRLRDYNNSLTIERRREVAARSIGRPDVNCRAVAAASSPEVAARRGRTLSERRIAWCPERFRADYRHLVGSKGVPAGEARAMIEREMESERARATSEVKANAAAMRARHARDQAERY